MTRYIDRFKNRNDLKSTKTGAGFSIFLGFIRFFFKLNQSLIMIDNDSVCSKGGLHFLHQFFYTKFFYTNLFYTKFFLHQFFYIIFLLFLHQFFYTKFFYTNFFTPNFFYTIFFQNFFF